jgi:glycosyltransferase involved in cell wall biosynthesis
LDLGRVHFLGRLPYEQYLKVLKVSACHAYLTYPFVLGWSCIEAMSTGCLVVGSRTAPVEEAIADGKNGVLVDFFDVGALSAAVCEALARPGDFRDAARRRAQDGARSVRSRARVPAGSR